jgi:Protein of unknown function (DUF1097)
MNLVTALAIVIGLLSVLITWLFLGPVLGGLGLSLWAAFIAWGSFFNQGGGEAGLQKSLVAAIWGAAMATVALGVLLPAFGSLGALAAPLAVGLTVAAMVMGAHIPALSAIPAAVYGYASTAAFALMMGDKASALGTSLASSPFMNIVASMIIGALFGYASEKLAGMLTSKAATA